ncbi:MAG: hypothetical protein IT295_07540 [Dehalococcoidia bacterium]|nr:hypothetical protein [Dehalococcoidia bacterium]
MKVHPAGAILVEAAVFGVAMLALMAMDRPLLATALGVLAVVSRSIKVLFDLRS